MWGGASHIIYLIVQTSHSIPCFRHLETQHLVSASSFAAEDIAGENVPPAPVVERQKPGLKKPRPPSAPPPQKKRGK